MDEVWDRETDVVVVGYGYSGGVAGIAAHDLGAEVRILEKMERPGGNSILSGGFFRITDDVDKAFAYLKRMCLNTVPDPVIHAFARELRTLPGFIEELADGAGVTVQERRGTGGTYRFADGPPGDALGLLAVKTDRAQCYPWLQVHGTGWIAFKAVDHNVRKRDIPVTLSTPVRELVTDERGRVAGVVAEGRGRPLRIRARKGVVLAAGGFEHNEQLRLQYLQAQPFYPICAPGNTGDGLLMGQKAGAGLWHMWHVHGGYGFKAPEFPVAFRHRIQGRHGANHMPRPGEEFSLKSGDEGPKMMPWIVVDRFGKRFMDEYPPAPQDSPWRDMSLYDVHIKDFPRIPSWMVFDENGRITGPMFTPISDDPAYRYEWSEDNTAELVRGWIRQAATVEGLARTIGVPEDALAATVARWNEICEQGEDTDFHRFAGSHFPIFKPPFYAVEVWPVITNTQGALAHDRDQRVLDSRGAPIPGLYCAGEMGGVFGHLYLNSGNNSEAFITGRIAGRTAAGERDGA